MKKLLLFFIDGIGLGEDDQEINPIRTLFSPLMDGEHLIRCDSPRYFSSGVLIPTDPKLGVAGIPQSATGQTTIFTGVNAQALIGYHLTGFPDEQLMKIIEERSLMKKLVGSGIRATSANLYSQGFFEERRKSKINLFPVSTLTIQASGVGFRDWKDYVAGKAVYADITNERIRSRGYDIDLIEPEEAAENMLNILSDFDFVFFEYFITDLYGHKWDKEKLHHCVEVINRFTSQIWSKADRHSTAILILSDHGNAEDMRAGHTDNMVPTVLFSENPDDVRLFAERVKRLSDIYDTVVDYFLR
jgi:hypothetical protein